MENPYVFLKASSFFFLVDFPPDHQCSWHRDCWLLQHPDGEYQWVVRSHDPTTGVVTYNAELKYYYSCAHQQHPGWSVRTVCISPMIFFRCLLYISGYCVTWGNWQCLWHSDGKYSMAVVLYRGIDFFEVNLVWLNPWLSGPSRQGSPKKRIREYTIHRFIKLFISLSKEIRLEQNC